METFGKANRVAMKWAEALNGLCRLEIAIWSIILTLKVVFTAIYPNRKAHSYSNSCCPQSIAYGVSGFQQGQAKKSLFF